MLMLAGVRKESGFLIPGNKRNNVRFFCFFGVFLAISALRRYFAHTNNHARTAFMTDKSTCGMLPIQPHLLAYLTWKENLSKGELFTIPSQSPIAVALSGYILLSLRLIRDARQVAPTCLKMERYTARLPFQIQGVYNPDFFIIADLIAKEFDAYLYHTLQAELFDRILFAKRFGMEEKDTIEGFLDESGLNYYLDFEAVKKAQYRLRQTRRTPTVRGLSIRRNYLLAV